MRDNYRQNDVRKTIDKRQTNYLPKMKKKWYDCTFVLLRILLSECFTEGLMNTSIQIFK